MQKKNYARAHAPEDRGNGRWRVRVVDGEGGQHFENFTGEKAEEEAKRFRASFNKDAEGRELTVDGAIEQWLNHCRENELRAITLHGYEKRIRRFLDADRNGCEPLTWLNGRGQKLYDKYRATKNKHKPDQVLSTSNQIYTLNVAKRFGTWLTKRKLLAKNPFAEVERVGRLRRGGTKRALTTAEAIAFRNACFWHRDLDAGIAALIVCYLGPRAGEVALRRVRDVDGLVLHIHDHVKTEESVRSLQLTDDVIPYLHAMVKDRPGDDFLFRPRSGKKPDIDWLRQAMATIGKRAGLPFRCGPHVMRRTVSRLTTEVGMAGPLVQAQLGHAPGSAVTALDYVGAESLARARGAKMAQILGNGATNIVPQAKNARAPKAEKTQISVEEWGGSLASP